MEETNQGKPYTGLLGLDNAPTPIKIILFVVAVVIGSILVAVSTIRPIPFPLIRYEYWPLSRPVLFVYGFPVCLTILAMRLAGLKWRWGMLAAFLSLAFPSLLFFIFYVLASIFIPT